METTVIDEVVVETWPSFLSRRKHEFYFVGYDGADHLRVNRRISKAGVTYESFYGLRVLDVDSDELKALGVWDKLSQEVKDQSVRVDDGDIIDAANKMEHARKHRRNKYPGVPREITCPNCNVVCKVSPGKMVKDAEKIAKDKGIIYTVEDFVKNFKCNKCEPKRRGKKPSHNLPPEIDFVCACGKKVSYPASIVAKKIAEKGVTLEKYVGDYKCRSCKPSTFGRVAGGSKLPPKVKLSCKCGREVTYPASVALKFAEKKGLTVEKYISGYQCQSCNPSPRVRRKGKGKK